MCGIAGIWRRDNKAVINEDLLVMSRCLTHRGPDDAEVYREKNIGLAHRRLSIIDISEAGRQPMVTEDGKGVLAFNGEIYNYRELKQRYLNHQPLKSKADTEVLLYLLRQKGIKTFSQLRGMFALAYWEAERQELLLVRDPFGKKPLYYQETEERLAFASEPKAILALNEREKRKNKLDWAEVPRYLLHEYIPQPASGWEGIKQVPPGHFLVADKQGVKIKEWWKPTFRPKNKLSLRHAMKRFDELLGKAVERRLVADVPVGVFLSGGLDSSTIAWYMQRCGAQHLHSCSIAVDGATFNEEKYAALAAGAIGTDHAADRFVSRDVVTTVQELQPLMDIPLGDVSLLPTYKVSQLARQKMKVVLSGDGADELLGGYGTFQADKWARKLPAAGSPQWRKAERWLARWPVSHRYFSLDFKLKSFFRGIGYPPARRHQVWLGSFNERELEKLLKPKAKRFIDEVFKRVDRAEERVIDEADFDQISDLTIQTYLADDILVKLDRATMAAGLEARTPFLDVDFAELVGKLPVEYKRNKRILRELMRGRLPAAIVGRPKQGFSIPLASWLAGPLYDWAAQILSDAELNRHQLVETAYVKQLLAEHRQRRADHRKKLWTLIMWQKWLNAWAGKNC